MNLALELSEYTQEDEKIIKSFKFKNTLCLDIFDKGHMMKTEVNSNLLKITDNFLDSLGVEFFVHDVILVGSLANYNWSEYSDIDLHIVMDFSEFDVNVELIREFFDAKKTIWNDAHNIKIKDFDVEIYVQDINDEYYSSGVYSILNNIWIKKPKKSVQVIDDDKILKKGEYYAKKIDNLIKLSKTKNVINKIIELKAKLKSFRKSGLEKGGEFSYENLTFKLLRRNGYIGKLMDLKNNQTDKKLSITQ